MTKPATEERVAHTPTAACLKAAKAVWNTKEGWDTVEELAAQIEKETNFLALVDALRALVNAANESLRADQNSWVLGKLKLFHDAEVALAKVEGK